MLALKPRHSARPDVLKIVLQGVLQDRERREGLAVQHVAAEPARTRRR